MALTELKIRVPEQMVSYIVSENKQNETERNAMIMYPYARNGLISHGRAAEIIGIKKWDLITLYDKLGIPYPCYGKTDFEDDLKTVEELKDLI